jgi:hypothetical protein
MLMRKPHTGPDVAFLPTTCLALLDVLHAARPQHTLIAADFDALPDVTITGDCAPLVSSRSAPGQAVDHSTLYVPWGSADIFFPTDFDTLTALYREAGRRACEPSQATRSGASGAHERITHEAHAAPGLQTGERGASNDELFQIHTTHMPTADFMSRFPESKATRTLSGYNPLTQDWANTRIFLGSRRLVSAL